MEHELRQVYEKISKATNLPPYQGMASLKDIVTAIDKILSELNEHRRDYTKLLEEHIEELSKTYQEISTLFELNNLFTNLVDPSESPEPLVELLRQTIPFSGILIELNVADKHIHHEKIFDIDYEIFEKAKQVIDINDDNVILIEPDHNYCVRNLLSVPIKSGKSLWGRITLIERIPDMFTAADRKILEAAAQQLSSVCERYVRLKREIERERLREQLEIARQIQMRLFPRKLPNLKYVEISADTIPAIQVGGDYYDILIREKRVFITVADVSGKGIPAALMMTSLRSALRTLSNSADSVSKLAESLNNVLCDDLEEDRFVTMVLLCLHCDGILQLVNAGHNPVLLLSENKLNILEAQNLPLGIMKNTNYKISEMKVKPGDILVAYTDGVVETRDTYGNEYGFERLCKVVFESRHNNVAQILENVKNDLDDFSNQTQRHDDTTITVIKYLGENFS